jgi:hypothetical protein
MRDQKTPIEKAEGIYERNHDKFAVAINTFLQKNYPNYTAYTNFQGIFHIDNKKRPCDSICATPFWESDSQIPVEYGNSIEDGDQTFSTSINLDPEEIDFIVKNKLKGLVKIFKNYIPVIIGTYKAKRKFAKKPNPKTKIIK